MIEFLGEHQGLPFTGLRRDRSGRKKVRIWGRAKVFVPWATVSGTACCCQSIRSTPWWPVCSGHVAQWRIPRHQVSPKPIDLRRQGGNSKKAGSSNVEAKACLRRDWAQGRTVFELFVLQMFSWTLTERERCIISEAVCCKCYHPVSRAVSVDLENSIFCLFPFIQSGV